MACHDTTRHDTTRLAPPTADGGGHDHGRLVHALMQPVSDVVSEVVSQAVSLLLVIIKVVSKTVDQALR